MPHKISNNNNSINNPKKKITEYFDSITVDDLCERAKNMGIKKDMKHPYDYSI